jgi:tetratricopeptide (TPR) repeat protein
MFRQRPSLSTALLIAYVALLLNSAYLAALPSPTLFFFANVALHVLLGLGLAAACAWAFWRSRRSLTPGLMAIALVFAISFAFGAALIATGNTRPFRWILYTHIVTAVTGTLALAGWLFHAVRRRTDLRPSLARAYVVFLAVLIAWPIVSVLHGRQVDTSRYRIVNPEAPLSMFEEGEGPSSPFFPSSSRTNVGGIIPANFFMTSESCGRCHTDIYDQWNSSAHHFSSFNNQWYRKSIEYMQDVVGTQPSKWCAGCHDHAVFFNGRFEIPIIEQINTPEAQAGLGCTSCHSIVDVHSTMGQGDFTVEYPPLHDLSVSENPVLRAVHDALLYLNPRPHRETFLKPFHTDQTAEFCSACHKVHLDVPVNAYRWFRGFNDYDNWQASGVSGQGARSFYYPPKPQKCADCHMPLVPSTDPAAKHGMVKSHRFPGANTALPYVNEDEKQLRVTQDFLRDGQVSIDIFGLVRTDEDDRAHLEQARRPGAEPEIASTFAVGEESVHFGARQTFISPPVEVIAPIDRVDAVVKRGESVRLEVVVRTRKVGHFFPGGTVDAFDVWVELEAVDDRGRTIFHSGLVEDDGKGPVEPGAHFYRSLLLDEHGNAINKRNAWMARSVAYVRLIPPGAADTVHYRLLIPEDVGERIHLRAKVNYRKFAWWLTQWSFAGVRDPEHTGYSVAAGHDDGQWVFTGDTSEVSGRKKKIPNLPITVMAEASATLRVLPAEAELPEVKRFLDPSVRERWNDYGIGLLLQGDLKGAEAAFLKVTEMEPGYADGWVNVGRARVQEGDSQGAEEVLRQALEIDPDLAKTHFFMAMAIRSQGRYDEALAHLRIAADQYPRDRVVVNQIGRILFLKREFEEAVAAFRNVLEIDPEDLQAHYNLMLCYRGLGELELAARHQTLYERFKADEASQAITGPYRQLNPHDNNERQPIHEHRSVDLTTIHKGSPPATTERKPSEVIETGYGANEPSR